MDLSETLQRLVDEAQFDRALELIGNHRELLFAKPRVELLRRDRKGLLEALEELLPLAKTPTAFERLGEMAKLADAPRLRRRIAERFGDPEHLHQVYRELGLTRLADRLVNGQFCLARVPRWALHHRAHEELEHRRVDSAERFFLAAGDAYSYHQLAELSERLGDPQGAKRWLNKALEKDPTYLWSLWRRAFPRELHQALEGLGPWVEGVVREWRLRKGLSVDWPAGYEERYKTLAHPLEWHHFNGWESLQAIRLTVIAEEGLDPEPLVAPLLSFHRRNFAGADLEVSYKRKDLLPEQELFEKMIQYGSNAWFARCLGSPLPDLEEGEIGLVLLHQAPSHLASSGFGGHAMAVVNVEPRDRFTPTVIAHEFYHAAAGLAHTDGVKFALDPFSLMGFQGALVPLEKAYLDHRQHCHLGSPPGTGRLVRLVRESLQAGAWHQAYEAGQEGLERDPLHLWLRTQHTSSCLRLGKLEEVEQQLCWRLEHDTSLNGQVSCADLALRLERQVEKRLMSLPGLSYEPMAHLVTAELLGRHFRVSDSEFELGQAKGLGAPGGTIAFVRAEKAETVGRFEKAEALYRQVLEDNPHQVAALRRVAWLTGRRGDSATAKRLLEQAGRYQKESPGQAYHQGLLAWQCGHSQPRHYRRALRFSRQAHAGSWMRLAYEGWVSGGRVQPALKRAVETDPESHLARCALLLQRHLEGHKLEVESLLRLDPFEPVLLCLALCHHPKKSRLYRDRLLKVEPHHPWRDVHDLLMKR